ncbi:MAG TPA: ester cyclase [Bacteroidota bacterium]|nr:ester cyclase [Bacteroidota bacterium]
MMKKTGLFVAALAIAGCAGPGHDLTPLGKKMDAIVNAHDLDGFGALLADDVTVNGPDGKTHTGKDSVKAWMAGLLPGFHVESRGWQQSGDTLTWMSTARSDAFAAMGVNPIKVNTMAVFTGDKLHYFTAALDQETAGKVKFLHFYTEVVNGGDIDAIEKYVAPDMVEHQSLPPGTPKGLEGVKGYFKMIHEAFPDLHGTPFLLLGDGELVSVSATWEGTNKGKFMGKPGSNRHYSWTVTDIVRLVDGKAVEHWGWDDMAEAMSHPK